MAYKEPGLLRRIAVVVLTVVGVFAVAFCAAVFAVMFMHADKQGMIPQAFSLQPLALPKIEEPASEDGKRPAPQKQGEGLISL